MYVGSLCCSAWDDRWATWYDRASADLAPQWSRVANFRTSLKVDSEVEVCVKQRDDTSRWFRARVARVNSTEGTVTVKYGHRKPRLSTVGIDDRELAPLGVHCGSSRPKPPLTAEDLEEASGAADDSGASPGAAGGGSVLLSSDSGAASGGAGQAPPRSPAEGGDFRRTLGIGSRLDAKDGEGKWYESIVSNIRRNSSGEDDLLVEFRPWQARWASWYPRDSPNLAPPWSVVPPFRDQLDVDVEVEVRIDSGDGARWFRSRVVEVDGRRNRVRVKVGNRARSRRWVDRDSRDMAPIGTHCGRGRPLSPVGRGGSSHFASRSDDDAQLDPELAAAAAPASARAAEALVTAGAPAAPRDLAEWAASLEPGDRLDARDVENKWYEAVVVERGERDGNPVLLVAYRAWEARWATWYTLDSASIAPPWTHVPPFRVQFAPDVEVEVRLERSAGSRWFRGRIVAVDSSRNEVEVKVASRRKEHVWLAIDSAKLAPVGTHCLSSRPASPVRLHTSATSHRDDSEPPADVDEWRLNLRVGTRVDARDSHGRWYEAEIVDSRGSFGTRDMEVHCHFRAWESRWDVWLPITSAALAPPFTHVPRFREWQLNDHTEVKIRSRWFVGRVVGVNASIQRLRVKVANRDNSDLCFPFDSPDLAPAGVHAGPTHVPPPRVATALPVEPAAPAVSSDWSCGTCTFVNGARVRLCSMCGVGRREDAVAAGGAGGAASQRSAPPPPSPMGPSVPEWLGAVKTGDGCDARDSDGRWFESRVIEVRESDVLVHFRAWDSRFDTWLPKNAENISPPYTRVPQFRNFRRNDDIEVQIPSFSGRRWFHGRVCNVGVEGKDIVEIKVRPSSSDIRRLQLDFESDRLAAFGTHISHRRNAPSPEPEPLADESDATGGSTPGSDPTLWECARCTLHNPIRIAKCGACMAPRPRKPVVRATSVTETVPPSKLTFREFSEAELLRMTRDFGEDGLVGSGPIGKVYDGGEIDGTSVVCKSIRSLRCMGFEEGEAGKGDFRDAVASLIQRPHRHLVKLIGYGFVGAAPCVVSERVPKARTLCDRLHHSSEEGALTWRERLQIAVGICRAVAHLHAASESIVHGDLRPENILLDEELRVYVSDASLGPKVQLDHVDAVEGEATAPRAYASPEVGRGGLGPAADVWALGLVLLELLTGQPVIDPAREEPHIIDVYAREAALGDDAAAGLADASAGDWSHGIAPAVVRVIDKCLQFWPARRWSAQHVAKTITSIAEAGDAGLAPGAMALLSAHSGAESAPAATGGAGAAEGTRAEADGVTAADAAELTDDDIPNELMCPITFELMEEPVVAADGHTYERKAIEQWLMRHRTSPKTNAPLDSRTLVPNHSIRSLCQVYRERLQKREADR